LKVTNKDLAKLIQYDDRFHPILAIDVAARYLVWCKQNAKNK
jgi:hypothetical protein